MRSMQGLMLRTGYLSAVGLARDETDGQLRFGLVLENGRLSPLVVTTDLT